jgi:ketosteroid isomerase-like protein
LQEFRILPILVGLFVGSSLSTATAQTKNPRQLAETAMLKADRDFNRAMAAHDMERFLSFVSETAAFDSAEGRGRDAVKKAWAPFFEQGGPTISWAPARAESLVAGDVGYTIGTWERHVKDARGNPIVRHGEYLTVWRKEKDGAWRATFDTGSTSPEGARVRPVPR